MKELYIVKAGNNGEYEDYWEHVIATFETLEEAENYIEKNRVGIKYSEIQEVYNEWYNKLPENSWENEDFDEDVEFIKAYPQYTEDDVWCALSGNYDTLLILSRVDVGGPTFEQHIKTVYIEH